MADQNPANLIKRSAPPGTTSEELVKYVLVELDVDRKNHDDFQKKMPELVELMFDHVRWELVFASYPITGVVSRFVHIWRIPNESGLVEVMREGAVSLPRAALPVPGSLSDAFRVCYKSVQELIERTSHTLMTSLPYDPTHVGFQTQTILIDAADNAYIIEHSELRKAAEDPNNKGIWDLAEPLEKIRRTKSKLRNPNKPAEEKKGFIERLQEHLTRGSAVAHLRDGNDQVLLFNLAGLKSRSVFQTVEAEAIKADPSVPDPSLGKVTPPGIEDVKASVDRLLIAMPWGGVYDVKAQTLRKLLKSIPKDHEPATTAALEPIRTGGVPIASIPTERDDIIGDGCACYVINLKSFR
jgi:hypothetical protein